MATFSIFGDDFNPDDFLNEVKLKVEKVGYKGQHRHGIPSAKRLTYSFVRVTIENTDNYEDWNGQINAVIEFLKKNKKELVVVKSLNGISNIGIDLNIKLQSSSAIYYQQLFFSTELLQLCGELGLSLEVTLIPEEDTEQG